MSRRFKVAAGVFCSYVALAIGVVMLGRNGFITPQMGLLMLVALFSCYVGFGILIAVYRFVNKLE